MWIPETKCSAAEPDIAMSASILQRVKRFTGLDRAIGFTVLARGWSSFSGLINIILIAHFLSPAEQGYYYTFSSLVAVQIVFELGFSFVIQQLASHERAHLSISETGDISGPEVAHGRLASVLQKSLRWYSVAAALLLGGLLSAGFYFFSTHHQAGRHVAWQVPWIVSSIAATLTFQIDPLFAFLEGCGYVPQIAKARFFQAISGGLLAWFALAARHGLFAPGFNILGQAAAGIIVLLAYRRMLLKLLRYSPGNNRIAWLREVWQFQWRIAVSWISGYFIFQLFTPILFAYAGAATAGRMGMSLSIGTAISSVGISWISTKSAPFGALISRKQFQLLDSVFFRTFAQSWIVCIALCSLAWLTAYFLCYNHLPIANRILSPLSFGLLLLTIASNHIVFAEAIYLRAHKQEKFLAISVCTALLMAPSTYFLGRAFGATGMMAGYLVINIVIGLGWGTSTFIKNRRVWHAA